ncbi:MAG: DeoR family transcriptional regulator, partial [Anaerorhabdus sp.]
MLAKERLAYIVNRLQVRPSISIQNLSKEMNVSLSTVQRDLRKLEQDGRIERSFGGAISNQVSKVLSERNEIAVSEKIHLHKTEKEIIAKAAVQQIQEGECIFLDSGTT